MNMENRVLSIQSHVVHGYVGNKSAVFPLQVLGFDVDYINTVQLSAHVAYPTWDGQILCGEDMKKIYQALQKANIHHYSHLLTGYIGSPSFAKEIVNVFKDLKATNPDIYIVCDPVLGDDGRMYVPEEILAIYRDELIPLSNLITPNQYEVELLTGIQVKTEEDALRAIQVFHNKGVETVVISSANLGESEDLTLLASTINDDQKCMIMMKIPHISATFYGTGDLFAACLLAWMAKTNGDLKISCENSINTMQSVLKRTYNYAKEHAGPNGELSCDSLELRLIQSKEDIENPKPLHRATVI